MINITCIQSIKTFGNISSIEPMSLENRLRIRPNLKGKQMIDKHTYI